MSKKSDHHFDIYSFLYPLHLLCKTFSLTSFSSSKSGYKSTLSGYTYTITFLTTFLCYYSLGVFDKDYQNPGLDSALDEFRENKATVHTVGNVVLLIDYINIYTPLLAMIVTILINLYYNKEVLNLLNKLAQLDFVLNTYNNRYKIGLNLGMKQGLMVGYAVGSVVFASGLEWNNCSMYFVNVGIYNQNCLIMCLVPLIVNALFICQYNTFLFLLRDRFWLINQIIPKLMPAVQGLPTRPPDYQISIVEGNFMKI